jgi:hypothetical protein
MSSPAAAQQTEAVRRHYDRSSPGYDRKIGVFERILFGGGRQWVCAQLGDAQALDLPDVTMTGLTPITSRRYAVAT